MERASLFVLKEPVSLRNHQNTYLSEQETNLATLRDKYESRISQIRKSYSSLPSTKSLDTDATSRHRVPTLHQRESKKISPLAEMMKHLNVHPPDLKEKLYSFLLLPPRSRTSQHLEIIQFFLQSHQFFLSRPRQIHKELSLNMMLKDAQECVATDIILSQAERYLNEKQCLQGETVELGQVPDSQQYFCIDNLKYKSITESYLRDHFQEVEHFLSRLELFKSLDDPLFNRVCGNVEIIFKQKGEIVYQTEQLADKILIVFKGVVARKVTIQIQKSNRIPLQKQFFLTHNAVYQVNIEFKEGQLLGYLELLSEPHLLTRSQTIVALQDSTLLSISYSTLLQLKHTHFRILQKQKKEKYPRNYQQLCNFYEEKMEFNRRVMRSVRGEVKEERRSGLKMEEYRIPNLKYLKSSSVFRPRKSVYC